MTDSHDSQDDIVAMRAQVEARAMERAHPPAVTSPSPLPESVVMQCERENFQGDAKIFIHLCRGHVLYVQRWLSWLVWKGHYWDTDINGHQTRAKVELVAREYMRVASLLKDRLKQPDITSDERDVLQTQLSSLLARAKRCRGKDRSGVLEYVHSGLLEILAIDGHELDSNPWLLGCANGVVDLATQEHRAGRAEDYITRTTPTEWQGLDADASPFLDFLLHILSDSVPLRDFLLRFLGMSLFAGQREHKFLVLFGEGGRNGKDTLMGILSDVLGPALCSPVPQEMFMEQPFMRDVSKPSPNIMALRGKRIVYASESSKRHKFNSEELKRQTGGGIESARGLYGDVTEWERTHTVILLTNELPAAPPEDEAFWTRLFGIELKRRYINNPDPAKPDEFPQDPDLRNKMLACRSGILAALVKGFGDYLRDGLQPPPEVTSFGEAYRKSEDVVGNFITECCVTSAHPDDLRAAADELSRCFGWWYQREVSRKVPSRKFFSETMRKKGFERRKISSMYYMGIAISDDTLSEWNNGRNDFE